MEWDPGRYLHFAEQRTRVVRDLVARLQRHLAPESVRRVVDLGCGPGNSTAVLAETWPAAELSGLDASEAMLQSAREAHPRLRFEIGEIAAWADGPAGTHDLVFSNSALQWVDDHAVLLLKLLRRVAPGGALALQVPAGVDAPACALPRTLAASAAWHELFGEKSLRPWHSESLAFYHDVLAPHAAALDLWDTEYVQIVPGPEAILDWYRGSGLRVYLQALPDDAARDRFEHAYLSALRAAYAPRPNGAVLFPFLRRFVIARARRGSERIASKTRSRQARE